MIKRESKSSGPSSKWLAAVVLTIVFVSPVFAHSIPGDTSIGTWDPVTRTYTLTTDVFETIQIDENNLTLDGAGYSVNGTGSGYGVYLSGRTSVTINNLIVRGFDLGIRLANSSNNNTLIGNTASNNNGGISLEYDSSTNTLTSNTTSNNGLGIGIGGTNNTLIGNTASNNRSGINVGRGGGNNLTGNVVNLNSDLGIRIWESGNNTLTDNSMSGNRCNFGVWGSQDAHFENSIDTSNTVDGKPVYYLNGITGGIYDSSTNAGVFYATNCDNITIRDLTLTGNECGLFMWNTHNSTIENVLASNNDNGIFLRNSNDNTLTGNTTPNNAWGWGIFIHYSSGNTLTGNTTTNSMGGMHFYFSNDNILIGNTADGHMESISISSCSGNVLIENITSGDFGIRLSNCSNHSLTANTASDGSTGIELVSSSSNILKGNIVSSNWYYGIELSYHSCGNTLTGNTISLTKDYYGIRINRYSNDNEIYNNNFVDNSTQAYVTSDCTGNIFNLPAPTGGNYWNDWTTPDADGDGFVDYPYVFDDGQDDFPWICPFYVTPVGDNVVVDLVDPESGEALVTLTFDEVTEAGVSAVTTTTPAQHQGPPQGFKVGQPPTIYNISTTATFAGNVEVCISYSGISYNNESTLELFHYENNQWVPVTTSLDTGNDIICGIVSSLSPFAVFELGNQPPEVGDISAPVDPVQVNATVEVYATFTDPDIFDIHTAEWDWGDGSTSPGYVDEENGSGTVTGSHFYTTAGVYTVKLTVTDGEDSAEAVFQYIVVYDPEGGFVTGGGWIWSEAGAYKPDLSLEGKANFGFVSKYKKGDTAPTGNTEFQFKAGDLNFHSSSYEWLVVTGSDYARYKGWGTINGEGDYRFMLWAGDAPDTFRIRIWEEDEISSVETDVYDNGFDQEIGGGSIVIHVN